MAVTKNSNKFKLALIFMILGAWFNTFALRNLTNNDPNPIYTADYPYDFLARREIIEAFYYRHEIYEETRFRFSLSAFRQSAGCATPVNGIRPVFSNCTTTQPTAADLANNNIFTSIGNLPYGIGINFSALFYDPIVANDLIQVLNLGVNVADSSTTGTTEQGCFNAIRNPQKADVKKQYGFVSSPIFYRKYGVRFESELLLIDTCFDALGLRLQGGVADIRQTVVTYQDLTCSAPPFSCPAHLDSSETGSCSTDATCCNQSCCVGYSCECKKFMMDKIIKQKDIIGRFLGIDLCDTFHIIGLEDFRLSLFWRHIYDLNPGDISDWPRVLFMPFIEFGVGIPMSGPRDYKKIFSVPLGNNGHASAGVTGGFTLDFLDTIDIAFEGGFTHFFKQKLCSVPMPTHEFESQLFPYKADMVVYPGPTWNFDATLNAYHLIDNLSVWVQYDITSHSQDHFEPCKTNIQPQSIYNPENPLIAQGLIPNISLPTDQSNPSNPANALLPPGDRGRGILFKTAECSTKWEVHFLNAGFVYDISPFVNIGIMFQAPLKQRNAYRSSTLLGSISMIY